MSTHPTLTVGYAVDLNAVLGAAGRVGKVARLIDGTVVYGTARCVGDQNGYMMHGADVRDTYLRVTTREGWEVFWPVAELVAEVADGTFAADYDW